MSWEVERIDWTNMQGASGWGPDVPADIMALAASEDEQSAQKLLWRIEGTIAPLGDLYESALYAIPLLYDSLLRCTSISRKYLLSALREIAAGTPVFIDHPKDKERFSQQRFVEIGRGVTVLFHIIENGTIGEKKNFVSK